MDTCKACASGRLDRVEWLEVTLFGDVEQVVAWVCRECGFTDSEAAELVPG